MDQNFIPMNPPNFPYLGNFPTSSNTVVEWCWDVYTFSCPCPLSHSVTVRAQNWFDRRRTEQIRRAADHPFATWTFICAQPVFSKNIWHLRIHAHIYDVHSPCDRFYFDNLVLFLTHDFKLFLKEHLRPHLCAFRESDRCSTGSCDLGCKWNMEYVIRVG